MSHKNSISIFERVIIMLFGVGVVLLGLSPLTKEYGSIRSFLESKSNKLSSVFENLNSTVSRSRLSDNGDANKNEKKAAISDHSKKKTELDNKDRKELDTLIDNVWK